MNVLLIAGGWSSERDVSLSGGKGIKKALAELGHAVTVHDPALSLDGLMEAAAGKDFAFINLHGSPGEDGLIQAMLDRVGCPYQGSGPAASILALNKAAAKSLFRGVGLASPACRFLNERPEKDWQPMLSYPLFIKANTGGSSLHMEKVERPGDLGAALDRLFAVNTAYLVESAVPGHEITCGILGELTGDREDPVALPPILIKPASGAIFDYTSKYSPGGAEELCPAPIAPGLTRTIQAMALAAHRALGCEGYSRADFIAPDIMDDSATPMLLEVNTLPGMTATSLLPREAAVIGLSFPRLVARLMDLGLARHRRAASGKAFEAPDRT
ncbi:MAG: D-alanine--D-alanine ligase [Desulfovibrio sp.]|jgi:D-alanine-D-alanine ligase|nr:D-alanine--D-alanine ligase [Desulfovibrio sp.]